MADPLDAHRARLADHAKIRPGQGDILFFEIKIADDPPGVANRVFISGDREGREEA